MLYEAESDGLLGLVDGAHARALVHDGLEAVLEVDPVDVAVVHEAHDDVERRLVVRIVRAQQYVHALELNAEALVLLQEACERHLVDDVVVEVVEVESVLARLVSHRHESTELVGRLGVLHECRCWRNSGTKSRTCLIIRLICVLVVLVVDVDLFIVQIIEIVVVVVGLRCGAPCDACAPRQRLLHDAWLCRMSKVVTARHVDGEADVERLVVAHEERNVVCVFAVVVVVVVAGVLMLSCRRGRR